MIIYNLLVISLLVCLIKKSGHHTIFIIYSLVSRIIFGKFSQFVYNSLVYMLDCIFKIIMVHVYLVIFLTFKVRDCKHIGFFKIFC